MSSSDLDAFKPANGLTFSDRLARCIYNGVFGLDVETAVILVTDPVTHSTFSVHQGETLGEALARFIRRWEQAEQKDISE